MKDKRKLDIRVGDTIAYATRSGNSGALNIGEVLEVTEHKLKVLGEHASKPGWLLHPERIVVLSDLIC